MPSLFNRRSRSVSTTRPTTTASSSAHLAAAQAFLAKQPNQSNLSASAAAAALRSMSPAQTPVDQVQTRRMLNRQTSNSSIVSAPRGRTKGPIQRRGSQGSMTERTFRSPSPGQPTSQNGAGSGAGRDAPPVPRVPQSYMTEDYPPISTKAHRRSASMEAPPPRVMSPPLSKSTARSQKGNQGPAVSSAATLAARQSAAAPQAPPLQRSDSQDSRNSFNFSYPRGSRPNSPPPRSPLGSSEALPNTATSGISASEAARIQSQLSQAAAKPVKKKKKVVDRSAAEGSHLQSGTMGGKPTVTPLEPLSTDYVPPTTVQPVKTTKKKAALSGQSSHFPDNQASPTTLGAGSDSDNASEREKERERRAQRAAGVLTKQPSVVREDWEGEQEEQTSSPVEAPAPESVRYPISNDAATGQTKKSVPEANMSRKIEDPSNGSKSTFSVHNAVTGSSSNSTEPSRALLSTGVESSAGRGVSISPSRSTRFSDRLSSDLASGRKHEPLGRSISPAKSALKHNHAGSDVSPSDTRFAQRRGSSVTPSEASDASDSAPGRRKGRVSFDSDTKDLPTELRSSVETNKRTTFGFGKGKSSNLETIVASDEVEEGMKPTPALPSFGSVRRNDRSASPNATAETREGLSAYTRTASSSETSSIADPPTMDTSISSDHALGGLLYKQSLQGAVSSSDRRTAMSSSFAASPAEGTGYESDTDSSSDEDDRPFQAAQAASQQLGKTVGNTRLSPGYKDEIPVIAVQPATPGLDESHTGEEWAVDVPGGFPNSSFNNVASSRHDSDQQDYTVTPTKEPAGLGLSDKSQDYSLPAQRESPSNVSPKQLTTINEEDSDDNSLYSDAAEDLSDLEGDGFGSINAIIESPVVTAPPKRTNPLPESPLNAVSQRRPADNERTSSWDDTQAHWSGLAQQFRENNESPPARALLSAATTSPQVETPTTTTKPRVQAIPASTSSAPKQFSTRTMRNKADPPKPSGTLASGSGSSSDITTKRMAAPKAQGHLKSSMRGGPEPTAAPIRQRPVSNTAAPPLSSSSSAAHAALQKKDVPPAAPPKAVRRFSNDSDSDSSFRRARRNRKANEGKFAMKRSMRNGPTATSERPSVPAGRGGVRSLSPPVDRRPVSSAGGKPMRSTMRGSTDLGTPTLRGPPPEAKRSSSLFSRNRTAKSPTRPATAMSTTSHKVKSRAADSDDEDAPRPTQYKSRFADSSDEDEPDLRPVRGIPRKKDEGDSTDLDDSSDDQARKAKPAALKKLTVSPPPENQEIASPPVSPTTAKKRGLWGRLRGKKKEEEAEPKALQTIAQREGIKEDIEAGKEKTSDAKQLGFSSAAEREAMVQQTLEKLEAAKNPPQSATARPQSPTGKLQRRITPQRVFSDSFVAPPKLPAVEEDRPQTSNGVKETLRPAIGSRQPTTEQVNGDGTTYGKSGKKKKFGFLRKAFGLTD